MSYAQGVSATDATIRTVDFKDKFFPGIHWKRGNNESLVSGSGEMRIGGGGGALSTSQRSETSGTASMHVDNILAGMKQEELKKLDSANLGAKVIKEKEEKYKPSRGGLRPINEDLMER